MLLRVREDLGRGEQRLEHPRLGHAVRAELAREPLAEDLFAAARPDRTELRDRLGAPDQPSEELVRVLVALVRRPRLTVDHLGVGPPDAVEDPVGRPVRVVRA